MLESQLDKDIEENQRLALEYIETRNHGRKGSIVFELTHLQSHFIEKAMCGLEIKKDQWLFLQLQRRPEQTLFKPAVRDKVYKYFNEEQIDRLQDYYRSMESINKKVGTDQFFCFLTLEMIRRNQLSKFFMHSPDPIYLGLSEYYKQISKPLDMTIIGHKLLRGQYKSIKQFEVDMVTMIHNFRVYFVNDDEMFNHSIQFQQLFWTTYTKEIKMSKQALSDFNRLMKSLKKKPIQSGRKKMKDFNYNDRKELNKKIRAQSVGVQKKIKKYLQTNCKKYMERGEVSLQKIPKSFLIKVQSMLKPEQKKQPIKQNKQGYNSDDIYEQSQETPVPLLINKQRINKISIEDALGSDDD